MEDTYRNLLLLPVEPSFPTSATSPHQAIILSNENPFPDFTFSFGGQCRKMWGIFVLERVREWKDLRRNAHNLLHPVSYSLHSLKLLYFSVEVRIRLSSFLLKFSWMFSSCVQGLRDPSKSHPKDPPRTGLAFKFLLHLSTCK